MESLLLPSDITVCTLPILYLAYFYFGSALSIFMSKKSTATPSPSSVVLIKISAQNTGEHVQFLEGVGNLLTGYKYRCQ